MERSNLQDFRLGQTAFKSRTKFSPIEKKIGHHVGVWMYYSTDGLYDPTNLADIPAWKKAGYGYPAATAFMFARALVGGGTVGYILDYDDKRKGGMWEWRFHDPLGDRKYDYRYRSPRS